MLLTPADESEQSDEPAADLRLRRLVVSLRAIDSEVASYRRKCRGEEEWTSFQLPSHLREAA